jgi:hypothetical protein
MIAMISAFISLLSFRFRSRAGLGLSSSPLTGRDPEAISQGAITYQLRRLRLHGLIERIPKTFRYRVTPFGLRIALFFTRTYNRLLRPGLAAALPGKRTVEPSLQRAFVNLDTKVSEWIEKAQMAV